MWGGRRGVFLAWNRAQGMVVRQMVADLEDVKQSQAAFFIPR